MTPKSKQQANVAKAREAYRNKIREEAWREMANYLEARASIIDEETLGPWIERFMAERGIRPRGEEK